MKRLVLVLSTVAVGVVVSSCAVGVSKPATEIATRSAVLNGTVISTTGGPGSYYIEYGPIGASSTVRTPTRPIDFVVNQEEPVTEPVDGLEPGTSYRFSVCAEDSDNPGNAFCSPGIFTTRPNGDFVSGAGRVVGTDFRLTVHGGSSGQNPTGFLTARGAFDFDATPTCLNVSGSAATTGYRIDTGSQAGSGYTAALRDNEGSVDQGLWYLFTSDPLTDCPLPTSPPNGSTIGPASISGDFEVVDEPPPTASAR